MFQQLSKEEKFKIAARRFKTYQTVEENIVDTLSDAAKSQASGYQDTIRNIAIVSGALATFSLTLLGSNEVSHPLLVIGIAVLLLIVLITCTHLLNIHARSSRILLSTRKHGLEPIRRIKESAIAALRGLKPIDNFLEDDDQFFVVGGAYDQAKQRLSDLQSQDNKVTHVDVVVKWLLVVAISLLLCSFALPYLGVVVKYVDKLQ